MNQFDRNDTYSKVVNLIAQKLNTDKSAIVPTKTLQELGADSLDLVEIIMKLEEQFGMEINDADAETLVNIDDVVNYVHQRRTK